MIKVNISNDKISIIGHAMYDDYGKDIVCASVSSIVITSVNAIIKNDNNAISYKENKDGVEIEILKKDKMTLLLINNMIDLLKELEGQYNENIKVIGG